MAFEAGNGLAHLENAGNSHKNEGSRLKPGVSPGVENVCNSKSSSEISAVDAAITVVFFILNFLL